MDVESKKESAYKRLDLSNNNFKRIIDNPKNEKFNYLDTWLLKTSNIFKKENINVKRTTFPRFSYGTIIKVDFGIRQGSEISGPHFAITLERYDSIKNPVITVLPLTSQNKHLNLPLNELIIDEFTKKLKLSLKKIINDIEILKSGPDKDIYEKLQIKNKEITLVKDTIDYYANYAKNSYACINQITTISKNKIMAPKNKFDIIGRAKCSSRTMKIISYEIVKKITNLSYNNSEVDEFEKI